jgi:hypothetical protein
MLRKFKKSKSKCDDMYSLEEECDVITNRLEYGKTWVAERKFALRERNLMWTLWLSQARRCLDMKWEHTIHYYILMITVDFSFSNISESNNRQLWAFQKPQRTTWFNERASNFLGNFILFYFCMVMNLKNHRICNGDLK